MSETPADAGALATLLASPAPSLAECVEMARHADAPALTRIKELFNLGLRGKSLAHAMRPVGVVRPRSVVTRL